VLGSTKKITKSNFTPVKTTSCFPPVNRLQIVIIIFSLRGSYGLDNRDSIPIRCNDRIFFLYHRVQKSSGAHPASSYSMGTEGSYPGSKAAGAGS